MYSSLHLCRVSFHIQERVDVGQGWRDKAKANTGTVYREKAGVHGTVFRDKAQACIALPGTRQKACMALYIGTR